MNKIGERSLSFITKQEGISGFSIKEIDDKSWLVENHCPICIAAKECLKLCSGELELFQKALGDGVQIERTEHIASGARRCVYTITRTSARRIK